MSRTAAPEPLRRPQYDVRLPPLHAVQQAVFDHAARFKVVVCGRQWGKTVLGACIAVEGAAAGGDIWWVAPTFHIGEHGWKIIDRLCRQIPGTKFEQRPIYRITLPGGGTIQLRSADNPDSLRGVTLSGVVMDEAAQAKEEAWAILRPTLSVRRGWALFISTPRGDNWFHDLYLGTERLADWAGWQFPSSTSPYQDEAEIELAKAEMSSVYFAQEFLAEFISGAQGVFKQAWFRYWWPRNGPDGMPSHYMLGEEHAVAVEDCRRLATVDLAYSQDERADYTVISSFAVTPQRHLILLDVQRGRFEGHEIVPMLRSVHERFGLGQIVVERYQRQLNIITDAVRAGLPVKEVRPDKDKLARALPLVARMEHGTVWFPRGTLWMSDLERELLAFPGGRHDDFVDTLAYAALQVSKAPSVYRDRGVMTV